MVIKVVQSSLTALDVFQHLPGHLNTSSVCCTSCKVQPVCEVQTSKISTSIACESEVRLNYWARPPFHKDYSSPFGTDVLQIEKQTGLIYNLFAPFDHATVVSQLSRPIMSITQWGDGSLGGQSLKFTFQPTCGERHGRRLLVHLILCFL